MAGAGSEQKDTLSVVDAFKKNGSRQVVFLVIILVLSDI